MKKILGLDLGTNSIGWAVVSANDENNNPRKIEDVGSRIIPMDAEEMGKFNSGNSISKTAGRTKFRATRRIKERNHLRRERLHRVLHILGFLPEHYDNQIGWDRLEQKWYGKFIDNQEPKLAWNEINGKNQFLFMDSFNEMLKEFAVNQPNLVIGNKKVPLDWTIYYLRKKALLEKISKQELAWLILNFNQKRGYYQLRGEDEEDSTKTIKTRKYFDKKKILNIIDYGKEYKGLKVLVVELEDGNKGKIFKKEIPKWIGLEKNIIATVDVDISGKDKYDEDGFLSQRFSIPTDAEWDTEWKLIKLKTEKDLIDSQKKVGTYIYESLLQNPSQKILGKLVRTIDRKYYREELEEILNTQTKFHKELRDSTIYAKCVDELYHTNYSHRQNIANWSFTDLFVKDILFYQRPLKSKKSLISECPLECRYSYDGERRGIKCIAKSHPLFQEFRLWKFIANLKIYQREKIVDGKLHYDYDATQEYLKNEDDYVMLFEWLNDRKDIEQNVFLGQYLKLNKTKAQEFRWNYVEDKSYPCNETRAAILSNLKKANISNDFLNDDIEQKLWHILYSVEDKFEIEKAMTKFAKKYNLEENFIAIFKKFPPFKKEYGSFSQKAIKRLLPLMRMGKYWEEKEIDFNTRIRIDKIISGEFDEKIEKRVREKAINLTELGNFKSLPEWLASYVVYNKFSEAKEITKWENPKQLDEFISSFKQHSLRNPTVEQVILETLRTVRDIWIKQGHIDEIHVELGREMKNDKKERERLTKMVTENENTNHRIKAMLTEFKNAEYQIDGVIPYSPKQQEILKIYEEFALGNLNKEDRDFEFISKIAKNSQPSKSEILKYKLWLEQQYRSPYTGEMIPLSKLFTTDYEIEHIIPQSKYFDDSFSNKVICESVVNKNPYKDNQLGYEFIKNNEGRIVPELSNSHKTVKIFTKEAYERFVKENYSGVKGKMKKLLMDEIPQDFIERQLNDTRYISKEIKRLLSNIVRVKLEDGEYEQEATSKNLISVTGSITSQLKQEWGLNDKWNEIILPRFERLNEITGTNDFTAYNKEGHKIPRVPFELSKGFTTKRIDHRHHAMDALVIACATRNHVNYLNNESAKDENKRYDLKHSLCYKSKTDDKGNYKWSFIKPWDSFPQDVKHSLDNVVVSFKQNLRIINKTVNYYQKFDENEKKQFVKQLSGENWAIRKPMHKDTVYGEVNLRKIKDVTLNIALENPKAIVDKELKNKLIELQTTGLNSKKIKKYFAENKDVWSDTNLEKIKVYYFTKNTKERYFATRKPIDTSFNKDKIESSITDLGMQKVMLKHLELYDNNPELAFSPDGIETMNRNITQLNGGKNHKPISKVRVYEKADKFAIGNSGNKDKKFVEAAKGTNLFFAVYQVEKYNEKEDKIEVSRTYYTIPLNEAIERLKKGKKAAPETDQNGNKLLFVLSPGDLVYVPDKDEVTNSININHLNKSKIYLLTDSSDKTANFIPHTSSSIIFSLSKKEQEKRNISYCIQDEYGVGSPQSKNQKTISGEMIKEICVPIKVNRLGHIVSVGEY